MTATSTMMTAKILFSVVFERCLAIYVPAKAPAMAGTAMSAIIRNLMPGRTSGS